MDDLVMDVMVQHPTDIVQVMMNRMYYILSYTLCTGTLHIPPGRNNGARGVVCVCVCAVWFRLLSLILWLGRITCGDAKRKRTKRKQRI